MIRTINNIFRFDPYDILFYASFPPSYCVESLHMAAFLLNIRPTHLLDNLTPIHILFNKAPSYDHIHTFGSICMLS